MLRRLQRLYKAQNFTVGFGGRRWPVRKRLYDRAVIETNQYIRPEFTADSLLDPLRGGAATAGCYSDNRPLLKKPIKSVRYFGRKRIKACVRFTQRAVVVETRSSTNDDWLRR